MGLGFDAGHVPKREHGEEELGAPTVGTPTFGSDEPSHDPSTPRAEGLLEELQSMAKQCTLGTFLT